MHREVIDSLLTEDWRISLASYKTLFVGFSGGLDSTVLLHALTSHLPLKTKLQAIHIHHGLSVNATAWQEHCQQYCDSLTIPFITREVQVNAYANIEENARIARYKIFTSLLAENDCLLLGHHADDLAETVLLQLFRGAGIDGMAAMAPLSKLAKGALARPFLHYSRKKLEAYAHHYQLSWIDDESNQSNAFSRNYLRQQIMPLLREKWPGVVGNLVRSAMHCQQAKSNLEALAELDCGELCIQKEQLSLLPLMTLSHARLTNVLRTWFRRNGVRNPPANFLQRLIDEVILGRNDASAIVEWDDIAVRRYQQSLYLLKEQKSYRGACIEWSAFPKPLQLDKDGLYFLSANPLSSNRAGLCIPSSCRIQVRFRQGGELFYWHAQTKKLKNLFQQWQIPPWQRDRIPLLYINEELAAVVGFAVSDHYYAKDSANLYHIELHSTRW